MNLQARRVQRTYLLLTLLSTLAASFIWGINTLFLLDAGLNNAEAFAANAFFTAGHGDLRGPHRRRWRTSGAGAPPICSAPPPCCSRPCSTWPCGRRTRRSGAGPSPPSSSAWDSPSSPARPRPGWSTPSPSAASRRASNRCWPEARSWAAPPCSTGSVAGGFIAQVTNLGVPYVIRSVAARRSPWSRPSS